MKREHYELMKLRIYKNDFYTTKAGDNHYPSTNEWGKYGWSFTSLEDAMNKIENLTIKPPECRLIKNPECRFLRVTNELESL